MTDGHGWGTDVFRGVTVKTKPVGSRLLLKHHHDLGCVGDMGTSTLSKEKAKGPCHWRCCAQAANLTGLFLPAARRRERRASRRRTQPRPRFIGLGAQRAPKPGGHVPHGQAGNSTMVVFSRPPSPRWSLPRNFHANHLRANHPLSLPFSFPRLLTAADFKTAGERDRVRDAPVSDLTNVPTLTPYPL